MTRSAPTPLQEELLLLEARAGNRRAGELLARLWQPRLVRTARRILRDDELARDAVQDAWGSICRNWSTLRDSSRFPAWAYGILYRRCQDKLRRTLRRRDRETPLETTPEPPAGNHDPTLRLTLDAAFARLNPEQRATALLFFGEGLTISEVAEALDIPPGTVKSRLHAARNTLKSLMKGDTP